MRERKLESTTRGKVLTMLREGKRTVAEMAKALHITDNGVRAQLNSLEAEGLARQAGSIPGTRKPFNAYELTEEGEKVFPNAYGALLYELLTVLGSCASESELDKICELTARRVADKYAAGHDVNSKEGRLEFAVEVLSELGGAMDVSRQESTVLITGRTCPIADLVRQRPRSCYFIQRLISSITGSEVIEKCDKGNRPRCCFELIR